MNRRDTLLALLALGAAPLAARAQQPAKLARIAYLSLGSPEVTGYLWEAFKRRLHELGYIEGKNVVFEERWAFGKFEQLPDLTKELVALKPDVIFTLSNSTVLAAQKATTTIPIVMATISDPVGIGFVKSLARPGGNITGLSSLAADHSAKLLELLLMVLPKLSRVAILYVSDAGRAQLTNLQAAAQGVGVSVLMMEVQASAEIEKAFTRMAHEHIRGLIVVAHPLFLLQRRQIAQSATKNRIVSVSMTREYAEAGGFMSYGSNYTEAVRDAARYVDKILKGAKPEDLPVEQATTFELVINLKTAKALSLKIPPEVLLRVDRVIE